MKIFLAMEIPLRELGTGHGFEEKVSPGSTLKNELGATLSRISRMTWRLGTGKLVVNKTGLREVGYKAQSVNTMRIRKTCRKNWKGL